MHRMTTAMPRATSLLSAPPIAGLSSYTPTRVKASI